MVQWKADHVQLEKKYERKTTQISTSTDLSKSWLESKFCQIILVEIHEVGKYIFLIFNKIIELCAKWIQS